MERGCYYCCQSRREATKSFFVAKIPRGGLEGVSISQLYLSSNEVRKKLGYYRGVCGNCGMTTTIEAASLPAAIPVVEDKVLITVCLVPVDNMAQNFVRYDTIRYEMLF